MVNKPPIWFLSLGFDDEDWCMAQSEQSGHVISDMDKYESEWKEVVLKGIESAKEAIRLAELAWPGCTGMKFVEDAQ